MKKQTIHLLTKRYSQTQIDDLLHELQTTLINRVSASREINDKSSRND